MTYLKKVLLAMAMCLALFGATLPAAAPAVAADKSSVTLVKTPYHSDPKALFGHLRGKVASNKGMPDIFQFHGLTEPRSAQIWRIWSDGSHRVEADYWLTPDSTGWEAVRVRTPAYQSTQTAKFRLVLPETATQNAWSSNDVTLQYENPRYYPDYRWNVYDIVQDYCPDVVITNDPTTSSFVYRLALHMNVATRPSGQLRLYAAMHECAHVKQFWQYYGSDHTYLTDKLNAIYGTTGSQGIEQAADCMAFRMGVNPDLIFGTYTKDCSGARGTAAQKLLDGVRL